MLRTKKYLNKGEYTALLREWNALNDSAEATEDEAERERFMKARAAIEAKVFKDIEKLVYKLVLKKCKGHPHLIEDSFSAAQLSILKHAFRGWNEEKSNNASFSTYACSWVRPAVDRVIRRDTPVVIPTNGKDKIMPYLIRGEEIPEELQRYDLKFTYGDGPVRVNGEENKDLKLWDVLSHTESTHEEDFRVREVRRRLLAAITKLPKYEDRYVVMATMHPDEPTLNEIGKHLGVTRQAVQVRRNKVFAKLRRLLGKEILAWIS